MATLTKANSTTITLSKETKQLLQDYLNNIDWQEQNVSWDDALCWMLKTIEARP